jgi:hypothetical protein
MEEFGLRIDPDGKASGFGIGSAWEEFLEDMELPGKGPEIDPGDADFLVNLQLSPGLDRLAGVHLYPRQADGVAFLISMRRAVLVEPMHE